MATDLLLPSCSMSFDEFDSIRSRTLNCRQVYYQRDNTNQFQKDEGFERTNQRRHQQLAQHDSSFPNKCDNKNDLYDTAFIRNTVAQAVITRLHRWCCQLFWLTIVCVMGCCGELHKSKSKTIAEVRRTIFNNNLKRCKDLNNLEVQLLRHLTNPQPSLTVVRPLRTSMLRRHQHVSRPPPSLLFDIAENDEIECCKVEN